jgi:hypothetical protein
MIVSSEIYVNSDFIEALMPIDKAACSLLFAFYCQDAPHLPAADEICRQKPD